MLDDLMGKMNEAQQKMDETKKRLDGITVSADAEGGMVKVTANGNKKILNIDIQQDLIDDGDKEAVEDLVLVAINRALEKAENLYETEMQNVAKGMIPPGMM